MSTPAVDQDELVRVLAERIRVQRLHNQLSRLRQGALPDDLEASGHLRDPEPPALTVPPHYLP